MSRLDDFADFCRCHPGRTLSDLLTLANYRDPAQRASLRSQMRRALSPDGKYRKLAEQHIVVPGPDDKGEWTVGLESSQNQLVPIIESNAFAGLRQTSKDHLPTRYKEHVELAQGTNLTGRKGIIINNALVVSVNEYERLEDQITALRQFLSQKDEQIAQLIAEIDFLRDIIRRDGGRGMVPVAAE